MAAGGGGGGRNDASQNSHSEMTYAAGLVVVVGVLVLCWFQFRAPLVYFWYGIQYPLLWAAKHVSGLGAEGERALTHMSDVFRGIVRANDEPFGAFWAIKVGTGTKVRYVVCALIAGMAALTILKMKGDGYKRKHNMASLAHEQARHWRTLTTSAHFKPDTAPPEWDQSMRPTDWIKGNAIRLTREEGLDEEACVRAFASQLGEVWRKGIEPETPIHVRCLCTIFALHYLNTDTNVGTKRKPQKVGAGLHLREEVAVAYTLHSGAALTARLEELIGPYAHDARVNKVIEKYTKGYAYTNTAVWNLLSESRKKRGVLASAEFLWLKGVDRTLWYGLNNCGRRAFLVEGGGVIAHYDAERIGGQPLIEPHVAEAVKGVKDYLDQHHIDDIEAFFEGENVKDI